MAMRGVNGKADKAEGKLNSETAFVAMQNGIVQALIHVDLTQIREEDVGIIRFLGYERGARHAGQAVFEKAEAYLKAFNVIRIFAFPTNWRYRFYHLEYASLSDALDHVQALLGFNGIPPFQRMGLFRLGKLRYYTNAISYTSNTFRRLASRTRRTSRLRDKSLPRR